MASEPAVEVEGDQPGREEQRDTPGEVAGEGEAEPQGARAMKLWAKRQVNQAWYTPVPQRMNR